MKKSKKHNSNMLNRLTKEVNNQYLPQKIKDKQCADNPQKYEDKQNKLKPKNYKSQLEYNGGVSEYLQMAELANKNYQPLEEINVVQNIHNDNVEIKKSEYNKMLLENVTKDSQVKLNSSNNNNNCSVNFDKIKLDDTNNKNIDKDCIDKYKYTSIQIPRRPKWMPGIKPKDFEILENESYLNWRRSLSEIEINAGNLVITPYEKNISVWRQLWLTIEKSQVLIQIVDARNPLFFRSEDLEIYIKSINKEKEYLLLVNKADLLTKELRVTWADYFKKNNINFMFFSALIEDDKLENDIISNTIEEDISDKEIITKDDDNNDFKHFKDSIINNKKKKTKKNKPENKDKSNNIISNQIKGEDECHKDNQTKIIVNNNKENNLEDNKASNNIHLFNDILYDDYKIYNRCELIEKIKQVSKGKTKNHNSKSYMIGFVGYPNVGKSSVINVLMKKKKVGVAMMPGKTKHYQTLFLPNDDEICLMDCPGLVFPSFTFSKADLVINGIIPIDKLTDFLLPIQLIIYNIPKVVFENYYKISLPDLYSSSQFLQVIANKYGYFTGRAIPNESLAAKLVLKDYVSGSLLYCYNRPDYNKEKHGEINNYLYKGIISNANNKKDEIEEVIKNNNNNKELLKQIPANFDDDYEKLEIDAENKLTKHKNNYKDVDEEFFKDDEELNNNINNSKIPKPIRMQLKFAVKRNQLSQDEYEELFTLEEAKNVLKKIEAEYADANKKNKITNIKQIDI